MCNSKLISIFGILYLCLGNVYSREFDRSLLNGSWVENTDLDVTCSNAKQPRISYSFSGDNLIFKFDQPFHSANGKDYSSFSAKVIGETVNALDIVYNSDAPILPGYPREWRLGIVGVGVYRWKELNTEHPHLNAVVGIKCS